MDTPLTFSPIVRENWTDYKTLMESRGAPHYCWCTAWIKVKSQERKAQKSEKKATMKERINDGVPVGLLAYLSGKPIGWCSIAPRETYKKLGGDETKGQVWSVVCFFIKKEYRKKGFTSRLLAEAVKYAKESGAKYVEGYPVAVDSPSYRFMGVKPLFENAGFKFIKKSGTRRNVFLRDLGESLHD